MVGLSCCTTEKAVEAVHERGKEPIRQISGTDNRTFHRSDGDVEEAMSIWPRNLVGVFIVIFSKEETLDRLEKEWIVLQRDVNQGKTTFLECKSVCQLNELKITIERQAPNSGEHCCIHDVQAFNRTRKKTKIEEPDIPGMRFVQ